MRATRATRAVAGFRGEDMTRTAPSRQTRRRLIALAIAMVGLGAALGIYLTAAPAPSNPLGYDPADRKQYLREIEVYGGKANELAGALREWVASLWHGRRLAVTVLGLTGVVLLCFWIASTPLPPPADPSPPPGPTPD